VPPPEEVIVEKIEGSPALSSAIVVLMEDLAVLLVLQVLQPLHLHQED